MTDSEKIGLIVAGYLFVFLIIAIIRIDSLEARVKQLESSPRNPSGYVDSVDSIDARCGLHSTETNSTDGQPPCVIYDNQFYNIPKSPEAKSHD